MKYFYNRWNSLTPLGKKTKPLDIYFFFLNSWRAPRVPVGFFTLSRLQELKFSVNLISSLFLLKCKCSKSKNIFLRISKSTLMS